jgi:hypothetical protein
MVDQAAIERALEQTSESAILDFKSGFDVDQAGDWLEIIKDIVAFANSGGGTILIGADDEGKPTGGDVSGALSIDPADLTNRIHKYTSIHFHAFETLECRKQDREVCAIAVGATRIPVVFTRVGTYEIGGGKQKTVFSAGTVYFRHGAKSEPGTSDDLRQFLEREIEATRRSWLDGIAKVVEAPTGARIAVIAPEAQAANPSGAVSLRLTNDPNAPAYYAVPIDSTHPFRQKEVVREVNKALAGRKVINPSHILWIRRVHGIQKDISLCFTQNFATPRYSQAFVDWIVRRFQEDSEFFEKTKAQFDRLRIGKARNVEGEDTIAASGHVDPSEPGAPGEH